MCATKLLRWLIEKLLPPIEISQKELDDLIKAVSESSRRASSWCSSSKPWFGRLSHERVRGAPNHKRPNFFVIIAEFLTVWYYTLMQPIKGFNYQISPKGEVYSNFTNRWLAPWLAGRGYPQVSLVKDGKKHRRYVHHLVAQAFLKPPEEKLQINHKDGNKQNNAVSNLEWCTAKENQQHAGENGLRVGRYTRIPASVKNNIADDIRAGKRPFDIMRKYGVSDMAIYRLKKKLAL